MQAPSSTTVNSLNLVEDGGKCDKSVQLMKLPVDGLQSLKKHFL
jgi:hypothetical protein